MYFLLAILLEILLAINVFVTFSYTAFSYIRVVNDRRKGYHLSFPLISYSIPQMSYLIDFSARSSSIILADAVRRVRGGCCASRARQATWWWDPTPQSFVMILQVEKKKQDQQISLRFFKEILFAYSEIILGRLIRREVCTLNTTMSGVCSSYYNATNVYVNGFSCPRPENDAQAIFCCGFIDIKYCCDDPNSFFPYEYGYMWWLR